MAGKINVTMVASTTLRRSLSPAPVITAGRKERRPLGSDALALEAFSSLCGPTGGSFLSCLPLQETRGLHPPPPTPAALGPAHPRLPPPPLPETPKAHYRGRTVPSSLKLLVCHRSLPAADPEQILLKEWWINAQT